MADWSLFFGGIMVLLAVLLVLTRLSSALFQESETPSRPAVDGDVEGETEPPTDEPLAAPPTAGESVADYHTPTSDQTAPPEIPLSTPALLANVVATQGLFGLALVGLAWYTGVPAWAFGMAVDQFSVATVATGVAAGGVLFALSESIARLGRQSGIDPPTMLRETLAPDTAAGWAVLLVVVLPVIAAFEELLFRGALIGVTHAGFGVPLWLLAVGSSVAFGLGHSAQGRFGIAVTGLLGVGLAAVFIYTGSLIAVIVAHYVLNVAEFVVHEGPWSD